MRTGNVIGNVDLTELPNWRKKHVKPQVIAGLLGSMNDDAIYEYDSQWRSNESRLGNLCRNTIFIRGQAF